MKVFAKIGLFMLIGILFMYIGLSFYKGTEAVNVYEIKIDDDNLVVSNVSVGTTVDNLIKMVGSDSEILDKSDNVLSSGVLKTGYRVRIGDNVYKISVLSDVNGDGLFNINDVIKLSNYYINNDVLSDIEYVYAGDIVNNEKIDINDIIRMARLLISGDVSNDKFEISYDLNGGTGEILSQVKIYNEKLVLSSDIPKRTGYTFVGWNTDKNAIDVLYNAGDDFEKNEDTILYAIWRKNVVKINYHVNGGVIDSSTSSSDGTVYNWTTSNSLIYRNGLLLTTIMDYDGSLGSSGLNNYNNSTYMNIKKNGYVGKVGAEWKCMSGCTTSGKTFDHSLVYKASDFCDASNSDCTVVLGVNWMNSLDRIHFIGNGTAFSTFINQSSVSGAGPSPSETILLESNGKFALIDTGLDNSNSLNSNRTKYVLDYLKSVGAEKLEFILITHVHYDHMGGASYILDNIPVSKLYMKVYYANDSSSGSSRTNNINRYNNLYNKASSLGIFEKINASYEGEVLTLGDMKINLFATKNMQYYDECAGEDENINSIITYVVVNGKKILLTGDMEPTTKSCLKKFNSSCSGTSITECVVSENSLKNIDLLKLPHHGYSSCDINQNIIDKLNTKYIVIDNWSAKVNYYYKGVTSGSGKTVGPYYDGSKSCRSKYFLDYPTSGDNKTAYYVNNNNVVFDFTNSVIDIYNN